MKKGLILENSVIFPISNLRFLDVMTVRNSSPKQNCVETPKEITILSSSNKINCTSDS